MTAHVCLKSTKKLTASTTAHGPRVLFLTFVSYLSQKRAFTLALDLTQATGILETSTTWRAC